MSVCAATPPTPAPPSTATVSTGPVTGAVVGAAGSSSSSSNTPLNLHQSPQLSPGSNTNGIVNGNQVQPPTAPTASSQTPGRLKSKLSSLPTTSGPTSGSNTSSPSLSSSSASSTSLASTSTITNNAPSPSPHPTSASSTTSPTTGTSTTIPISLIPIQALQAHPTPITLNSDGGQIITTAVSSSTATHFTGATSMVGADMMVISPTGAPSSLSMAPPGFSNLTTNSNANATTGTPVPMSTLATGASLATGGDIGFLSVQMSTADGEVVQTMAVVNVNPVPVQDSGLPQMVVDGHATAVNVVDPAMGSSVSVQTMQTLQAVQMVDENGQLTMETVQMSVPMPVQVTTMPSTTLTGSLPVSTLSTVPVSTMSTVSVTTVPVAVQSMQGLTLEGLTVPVPIATIPQQVPLPTVPTGHTVSGASSLSGALDEREIVVGPGSSTGGWETMSMSARDEARSRSASVALSMGGGAGGRGLELSPLSTPTMLNRHSHSPPGSGPDNASAQPTDQLKNVGNVLTSIVNVAMSAREACAMGQGEEASHKVDEIKRAIEIVAGLLEEVKLSEAATKDRDYSSLTDLLSFVASKSPEPHKSSPLSKRERFSISSSSSSTSPKPSPKSALKNAPSSSSSNLAPLSTSLSIQPPLNTFASSPTTTSGSSSSMLTHTHVKELSGTTALASTPYPPRQHLGHRDSYSYANGVGQHGHYSHPHPVLLRGSASERENGAETSIETSIVPSTSTPSLTSSSSSSSSSMTSSSTIAATRTPTTTTLLPTPTTSRKRCASSITNDHDTPIITRVMKAPKMEQVDVDVGGGLGVVGVSGGDLGVGEMAGVAPVPLGGLPIPGGSVGTGVDSQGTQNTVAATHPLGYHHLTAIASKKALQAQAQVQQQQQQHLSGGSARSAPPSRAGSPAPSYPMSSALPTDPPLPAIQPSQHLKQRRRTAGGSLSLGREMMVTGLAQQVQKVMTPGAGMGMIDPFSVPPPLGPPPGMAPLPPLLTDGGGIGSVGPSSPTITSSHHYYPFSNSTATPSPLTNSISHTTLPIGMQSLTSTGKKPTSPPAPVLPSNMSNMGSPPSGLGSSAAGSPPVIGGLTASPPFGLAVSPPALGLSGSPSAILSTSPPLGGLTAVVSAASPPLALTGSPNAGLEQVGLEPLQQDIALSMLAQSGAPSGSSATATVASLLPVSVTVPSMGMLPTPPTSVPILTPPSVAGDSSANMPGAMYGLPPGVTAGGSTLLPPHGLLPPPPTMMPTPSILQPPGLPPSLASLPTPVPVPYPTPPFSPETAAAVKVAFAVQNQAHAQAKLDVAHGYMEMAAAGLVDVRNGTGQALENEVVWAEVEVGHAKLEVAQAIDAVQAHAEFEALKEVDEEKKKLEEIRKMPVHGVKKEREKEREFVDQVEKLQAAEVRAVNASIDREQSASLGQFGVQAIVSQGIVTSVAPATTTATAAQPLGVGMGVTQYGVAPGMDFSLGTVSNLASMGLATATGGLPVSMPVPAIPTVTPASSALPGLVGVGNVPGSLPMPLPTITPMGASIPPNVLPSIMPGIGATGVAGAGSSRHARMRSRPVNGVVRRSSSVESDDDLDAGGPSFGTGAGADLGYEDEDDSRRSKKQKIMMPAGGRDGPGYPLRSRAGSMHLNPGPGLGPMMGLPLGLSNLGGGMNMGMGMGMDAMDVSMSLSSFGPPSGQPQPPSGPTPHVLMSGIEPTSPTTGVGLSTTSSGAGTSGGSGAAHGNEIPVELKADVDKIFLMFMNQLCSNLEAVDGKGEPIHQTLMAKKMQRLDESPDFRPFKFRIQAFTNAFLEELAKCGFPEDKIPMKKVRNYLWTSPYISRFNEDGKKAKSKGNHIWNVDAKKLPEGGWVFRPFHRKLAGPPPPIAYVGAKWNWAPRIWDPQASRANTPVQFSSPSLPSWLEWRDGLLTGTPPPDATSCDVVVSATFLQDGKDETLTSTFRINVAPSPTVGDLNTFAPSRRPSVTMTDLHITSAAPRDAVSVSVSLPSSHAHAMSHNLSSRTHAQYATRLPPNSTMPLPLISSSAPDADMADMTYSTMVPSPMDQGSPTHSLSSLELADGHQTSQVIGNAAEHVAEDAQSCFIESSRVEKDTGVKNVDVEPPELKSLMKQKHVLTVTSQALDAEALLNGRPDKRRPTSTLATAAQKVVYQAARQVAADRLAAAAATAASNTVGARSVAASMAARATQVTVDEVSLATQSAVAQAVEITGPYSNEVDVLNMASKVLQRQSLTSPNVIPLPSNVGVSLVDAQPPSSHSHGLSSHMSPLQQQQQSSALQIALQAQSALHASLAHSLHHNQAPLTNMTNGMEY